MAPMKALRIDRQKSEPLHAQIERQLRVYTCRPGARVGQLLPDEVSLAKTLGVSRNTLRVAIERLVREGLLVRRPRVGTRIARPGPLRTNLSAWHSFTEEMRRQGVAVETFALEVRFRPAPADATLALGLDRGARILHLRRIRGWEGHPALIAESWLHPRLGLTGREDFRQPLYEVISKTSGVSPRLSREEITAGKALGPVARELRLPPGAPVLVRRRTILDRKGRPIEYARLHYRPDRYTLTMDVR
jgi:GntR family transcriptional regulator